MSSEDLAANTLPQETPQQGDQSQMMRQRRALAQAGSPQQGPQAQQGPQQPPLPQGPPQQAQPPAQPPPAQQERQPLRPDDLRPGGPVFMQPRLQPALPWKQQVRAWAAHPDAGPFTAMLRRRLQGGSEPPQQ